VATLVLGIGAVGASAATVYVESAGIDQVGCGVSNVPATDACGSIAYAVNSRAVNGDTVQIGSGTFPLTTNALITNKDLNVVGAGINNTVIDGQNATTLTGSLHGMFRITSTVAGDRTVAFSDFSIVNVAKIASGTAAYGIYLDPGNRITDISVNDVKVTGAGPAITPDVFGVSLNNNLGDATFDNFQYSSGSASGIVAARQRGDLSVENSSFTVEPTDTAYALTASSNGASADITGDFNFRNNSFNGINGINVDTTSTVAQPVIFSGQLTIADNSFTNVNSSSANGIRIQNAASPNTIASPGAIENVTIEDNSMTGLNGNGVQLVGDVKNTQIEHNSIRGYLRGIYLVNNGNTVPTNAPSGTDITANQLVNNKGQSTIRYGLYLDTNPTNITADANWWGCNTPPTIAVSLAANQPCDGVRVGTAATQVTRDTWVQLLMEADPDLTLPANGSADVSLGFDKLNNGDDAPDIFPDGTVVPLTATRGSLSTASPTLTDSRTDSVFTSDNWHGNRSVSATFDNQTTTHRWDDLGPVTLHVETPGNGGVDSATCGPTPYDPCATIQQAILNAVNGDSIVIGAGTFSADTGILIDKSLDISGAGASQTIVTGNDSTTLARNGTIAFSGAGLTQKLSGLSVVQPGRVPTVSAPRYAFFLYGTVPAAGVDVTIEDVSVTGPGAGISSTVLETGTNNGDLTIRNLTTNDVAGNQLLIQRVLGSVLVEDSTFNVPSATTAAAILDASYFLGAEGAVTEPHVYRDNTFNAASGISVNAGFASRPARNFAGITIEDNVFHSTAVSGETAAIHINNASLQADGSDATFGLVSITGNTIDNRVGIALTGLVTDAEITGNDIRSGYRGVRLRRSTIAGATSGNVPTGTKVNENKIVVGASANAAVYIDPPDSIPVDLAENWWGCNAGPSVGAAPPSSPCGKIVTSDSGVSTPANWVVMKFTGFPYPSLGWQGSSLVSLDLTELNTGDPAPELFADGTQFPVTTTMGSVDDTPLELVGGEAATVFNSDWRRNRSAAVTLDYQTITLNWTDDPTPLTIHVETPANGGVDTPTCGPLPHDPCATIAHAVNNQAIEGDTVEIGEGTFPVTSNAIITGKTLTVRGQGKDETIIDGQNATTLASAGMFRLTGNGAGKTVSFSDFSMINVAKTASGTEAYAIFVNGGHQTLGMDVNVTDVRVSGRAPATSPNVIAIDSGANRGTLHVDGLEYVNGSGNAILLERHEGPVLVENSSFTQGANETDFAIFDYSFGGPLYDVTGDHIYRNNSFSSRGTIYVSAGFAYTPNLVPSSYLGRVVFEDNDVHIGASSNSPVVFENRPQSSAATSAASFDKLSVSGNKIYGDDGTAIGVKLIGKIADAEITQNSIRNTYLGIDLANSSVFTADAPSGTNISANQLVDNRFNVGFANVGLRVGTNVTDVTANGNWWGCNAGPVIAKPAGIGDCDAIVADPGQVTLDDWVVLGLTASVNGELGYGASSGLTAGFTKLNTGGDAPEVFADGTVLPMSSTGGTLTTLSPTLTDSETTNTFTSTSGAGRSASATFDHQTVTKTWDDVTYPTVTITSPANNSLTNVSPVTVTFTATDPGGGTLNCVPADGSSVALSPGANAIVVSCTDSDGNVGIGSVAVTYDNTPPSLTIVAPANGSITSSANTTLVFLTDDEYGPVTCDHTNGQSIPLNEGTNPITVKCTDAAGNETEKTVTVTRDSTPPVIDITQPLDGSTTLDDSVVLVYTVTDATATTCTPELGTSMPLTIGSNTITVNCTDAAGNVGTRSTTVTRQSRAPEITITSPTNGSTTTDPTATLTYTATSPVDAEFTCTPDSGTIVPLNFNSNTITVNCEDEFGLTSSASVTVTRIDTTKPVVTIEAPANGTITNDDTIDLEFSVVDDTATTCNYVSGEPVDLDVGSNAISVICTDAFGNVGSASISVIRDNTAPTVTIVSPPNNTITNATSIIVNYTANDDYGVASCSQADGTSVALDEGPNTITVYCTDRAGNIGSGQITVVRDTVAPVITITSPSDNSTTNDASVSLAYSYVDDGGGVTCDPANNSQVDLNYGPNTITVTCTDAAGNVGTKSVSVTRRSDTAPVLSISSPANGSIITGDSTTLVYQAASEHGTVSCTPPSGSTIPLNVGQNTLTVTCTDNFGNTTTASVTVVHPDALPECARDIAITDVQRVGARTRIRGVARLRFAGQKVKIQYQPTGNKTVGQATIQADGSWSIVVRRPSRPKYTANNARYRAVFGTTKTAYVKITRRMSGTAVTYDGNGRLVVSGSATKPLVRGARVRVMRSDECGAYRQIGTLPVRSNGVFSGSVGSGGGSQSAAFIRLTLKVARDKRGRSKFNTYSIVQPVVIER
jgi:hypothetical protein